MPLHDYKHPLLDDEQIAECKEAFALFDKDGDGTIVKEELAIVMASLGHEASDRDLDNMIAEVDEDGNGEIDFGEFLQMMAKNVKAPETKDDMVEAFKIFDRDGDGYISAHELRLVCKNLLGISLVDAQVDEMIGEADTGGNATVSYDDFVRILQLYPA